MIEITDGKHVISVTNGAFETIYKRHGYWRYFEDEEGNGDSVQSALTEDEIFVRDLEEDKPISQWNKEELERYASIQKINLDGTRNLKDKKARIKDYWDECDAQELDDIADADSDEWNVD